MRIEALSGWTSEQRHVVAACFLGWTLDAFDFFLLVFVLKDIAQEFNTQITEVTFAILLTLAMRPVGAYLFGRAADRWGRRPTRRVRMQFNLRAASGTADEMRDRAYTPGVRRVDGAPATCAISKADIRLRRNICRSGPISDIDHGRRLSQRGS